MRFFFKLPVMQFMQNSENCVLKTNRFFNLNKVKLLQIIGRVIGEIGKIPMPDKNGRRKLRSEEISGFK